MHENFIENPLKIHCCRFQTGIYPWIQRNLYTPFWRFYWNRTTGGILTLADGQKIEMTPEYFYLIPGYLTFSTSSKQPFDQFFIHFNLSDRQKTLENICKFPAEKHTLALISNFIGRQQNYSKRQLNYFSAAAILASTLLRLDETKFVLPPPHDPGIEKILKLMDDHDQHHKKFTNSELADMAGMSRAGFIAKFTAETGETPQAYWKRKRMENACKLLNFSNLSLDEIAEKTGFANRYHFSRVFADSLKVSPARFRKKLVFNQ
ncbi:MAG: helix-turn-helix transcriptional regulator [Lentisphaerae bacterium]|nr:helix-turn-helix transcriptional regulator [Lentisphaerota bacterium]